MIDYYARFARTGDPNGGAATAWPRYDATNDTDLVIDLPLATSAHARSVECDFWDSLAN
jgi:carboxylesterase type B